MGVFTGQIEFSGRDITIWGQNKTMDASGTLDSGRFFYSAGTAGSSLTLHWMVLEHGYATEYGGAVYTGGGAILKIYDTIFQGNTAIGGIPIYSGGGAIYAVGATVEIYTSTFQSNQAVSPDQFNPCGGAILGENANMEIHDSMFLTNSARHGGAIYAVGATVKIYTSTFQSNQAVLLSGQKWYRNGGAVFADGSNVEVHDTTFLHNTAGECAPSEQFVLG
jgi:predicted outer membrane repeat protein